MHYKALLLILLAVALVCCAHPVAGQGTTVQLPTFGVSIDAQGVLKHQQFDAQGQQLREIRRAVAKAGLPRDVAEPSKLRMISLPRLEAALRRRIQAGQKPDATERHLAGLTRLRYVFLYPETHDIVIAGEAAPWFEDISGQALSLDRLRPVLGLADLCVALRAFRPGGQGAAFVGCSIDPSPDAVTRLTVFQKTVPSSVTQAQRRQVAEKIDKGLREALGMSNMQVFGISPTTRMAQTLLEADYRMKMIAIDLEPAPVPMTTFLGGLQTAPQGMLQRWWFQPNYECVKVSRDKMAMELCGQGVQLLTENVALGPDGKLINPGSRPSGAAERFAKTFTSKYPDIAARSPVFGQLRNEIDLLVAAAFMAQEGFYDKAGWELGVLGDEKSLPTETQPAPKQAPCAVNVVWKGSRLLAPAGGVSIRPGEALEPARLLKDKDGKLAVERQNVNPPALAERWWWD